MLGIFHFYYIHPGSDARMGFKPSQSRQKQAAPNPRMYLGTTRPQQSGEWNWMFHKSNSLERRLKKRLQKMETDVSLRYKLQKNVNFTQNYQRECLNSGYVSRRKGKSALAWWFYKDSMRACLILSVTEIWKTCISRNLSPTLQKSLISWPPNTVIIPKHHCHMHTQGKNCHTLYY